MNLDTYKAEFEKARSQRSKSEPARIGRMRGEALSRFLANGFPTTKHEEWRFTSVEKIATRTFTLAGPGEPDKARPTGGGSPLHISPFQLREVFGAELVFVDGWYAPALSTVGSLPQGAQVGSLTAYAAGHAEAVDKHLGHVAPFDRQPFVALNTAFFADGAYVNIPARTVLEKPIHLQFISTDGDGVSSLNDPRPHLIGVHPRVLIVMGEQSQAAVVESYAGPAGAEYFTNVVTEVVMGEQAVLDHYKLQHESNQAFHIGAIHVKAARSASCSSHSISLGGALVRNDVVAVLGGEGGHCTLNGLYLVDGNRHVDNHTTIDHAMPNCDSREIYKGILADKARGVFNGKIIVRPDAQKTDAKQTNRALLLSEDAQINSKPELEIFANDVKCTHGAAVGQLDKDAVFYLRSRGIGLVEARHLLIHAFAGDVLNRLPILAVRKGVEDVLHRQLETALQAA
jgi:Fe-S cluster assembly protein SufD